MNIKAENSVQQIKLKTCNHCEGKGYTEIRDCAGQVQRTETCSYCEGRGNTNLFSEKTSETN